MEDLELFSIGSWAIYDHLFRLAKYPKDGDTVTLDMPVEDTQKIYFGDCSANIAAVAARLGIKSGLGMVVGDDFINSGYQAHLQSLGVDLQGVEVRNGEMSGHNWLYFDRAGDGFCISHQGLAADQSNWDAPVDVIQHSQVVVLSEMFSPYTLKAGQAAQNAGAKVVLNGMVGTAGAMASDFLRLADILFIAHSELSDLLALMRMEKPEQLIDFGMELVFATHGKHGSWIYSRESVEIVPAVRMDQVLDPTGAGDSYAAGTLSALIRGYAPAQAAQIGATVSSFIIQAWGCQTNLPTWGQVLERHARNF